MTGGDVRSGRRTFRSFKNPVYRLFFGVQMGQMAALNMQMMARILLVKQLTESPALAALTSVALTVPMLLLSLFGGVMAERVQKKYVIAAGQAVSAVVALGVALSISIGYLSTEAGGSWWILIVASVLQGMVMGLMMPSRQAILPEIVGERELLNAVALGNLGANTLRIVAPAAAGFVIDYLGFQAVYFIMTGFYLASAGFALALPLASRMSLGGRGALKDVVAGLRYVRSEKTILFVLVFTLLTVLLSMPYVQLMPFFTEDILLRDASDMGIMLSVAGAGAIAGSIILASLPDRKRGLMLLASGVIMGAALVGFALSSSWPLSLGLIVFVGLGQTGRMTLGNTLVQYYVADEYRGRVMSIYMMNFGFTSFGVFAAGMLAESLGVQVAVGGFAAVLLAISALAILLLPRIRKLD